VPDIDCARHRLCPTSTVPDIDWSRHDRDIYKKKRGAIGEIAPPRKEMKQAERALPSLALCGRESESHRSGDNLPSHHIRKATERLPLRGKVRKEAAPSQRLAPYSSSPVPKEPATYIAHSMPKSTPLRNSLHKRMLGRNLKLGVRSLRAFFNRPRTRVP